MGFIVEISGSGADIVSALAVMGSEQVAGGWDQLDPD